MKAIPIILAAAATAVSLGIATPAAAYWPQQDWRWQQPHRHHYYPPPYHHQVHYVPSHNPWSHHYHPPRPHYRNW